MFHLLCTWSLLAGLAAAFPSTESVQPGTHIIKLERRGAAAIFTSPKGVFIRPAAHEDRDKADNKLVVTLQNAYDNTGVADCKEWVHSGSGATGQNLTYVAVARAAYLANQTAHNQTVANVTGLINPGGILPNATVPLTALNGTSANATHANATAPLQPHNSTLPSLAALNSTLPVPALLSVSAAPTAVPTALAPLGATAGIAAVSTAEAVAIHPVNGLVQPPLKVERRAPPRKASSSRKSSPKKGGSSRSGSSKSSGRRGSGRSSGHSRGGKGTTESVPLQKTTVTSLTPFLNGNMWAGQVQIGSPAQTLVVSFDTGSADLVVASTNCPLAACQQKAQYNAASSKASKSAGRKFTNTYGDGSSTTGNVYTDNVQVGDLSVKAQAVNSATSISGMLASIPTDGLLGLAYRYLSSTGSPGFFGNLIASKVLAAPQFGLKYSVSGDSELFLGGTNSKQYSGSIEWHPVFPYTAKGKTVYAYWALNGGSATVGGKSAGSSKTFIIDSGTSLMYAPTRDANAFYAAIPGAGPCTTGVCAGSTDLYQFPCSSSTDAPNVSFSINGGRPISLGSSFNLGLIAQGSNRCVGALLGGSLGPTGTEWLLGAVFMQHVYSAFDMGANRVGFAPLA